MSRPKWCSVCGQSTDSPIFGNFSTPNVRQSVSPASPPVVMICRHEGNADKREAISVGSTISRKASEALPFSRLTLVAVSKKAKPLSRANCSMAAWSNRFSPSTTKCSRFSKNKSPMMRQKSLMKLG